jgi:hypothetical protein
MSYELTLPCGCVVYVSCHPKTRVAHTRVVQSRGACCASRKHDVGARLFLWEILPDRTARSGLAWIDEEAAHEVARIAPRRAGNGGR